MRRSVALILVLSFPVFLFLNYWQVLRYQSVNARVADLREEQKEWIEENKRLIVGIEYLTSPERIARIASEELDLVKIDPSRILEVRILRRRNG